ncbi:UDP-glucose dehydrogenase family protein, partial [Cellulomonas sp. NPDC057328]|uniref:UDP-glucose dehydrogenase family protein n=1 Tax=Cellulomonas sp. NPDC057328 TaxID=3346101 RepID=UPI0036277A1F
TGYLGATHAVAMAELGFDVTGVDTDQSKVDALQAGKVPFFEPGLPELLEKNLATGRLRFTTDVASAVSQGDVHFVCVGTPQQRTSHAADLRFVEAATTAIARHLTKDAVIVGKSTVPVGTAARLRTLVAKEAPAGVEAELVWNPEFLREGKAVADTLHPDRIVLGGVSARSEATLRQVYAGPIAEGTPVVVCDLPTAELVKVSANAFLATKISFINAIAGVCEAAGADVTVLADALGHDVRIGRQFLDAGLGFGGGCLPKDIRALMHRANELGAYRASGLLQQVDEINMGQRERVIDLALEACGGSVLNKRIGVLGAAFKPLTDDVRDSPALNVAAALHLRGAQVTVYDPEAGDTARRLFPT